MVKKIIKKVIRVLAYNWELCVICLLFLLPLFWFSDHYVLLGHDSGFRLDYTAQLANIFYSWDPKMNFGVLSYLKGFLVTQFPEIFASSLTHSFALGEKLSLVFWFSVMGAGMYTFLKRVFPEKEYAFFRLFSSIFYMYNFFILNAWGIAERAKFSLYAALPLGLLLVFDVFLKHKSVIRNGILFGLLYFFLNGGGALPLYGATLVIIGSAFVLFTIYRVRKYGFGEVLFATKTILAFVIPFLLFNAYYIVPNYYALRTSYVSSVGSQGGIDGLIAWERVISKNASLVNLLRLQGMPDWYNNPSHPYSHWYIQNPILILASFIPVAIVILGFILFRFESLKTERKTLLQFFLLVLPIGLFITMGTHPPVGVLYELAMKKIPGFVMFRSSFYKFAPALWFPMIVLCGYFLNQFLIRIVRSKTTRFIIGFALIIGLLVYHFPYFTADAFVLTNPFSTRVIVPAYVSDATVQIQKIVGDDDGVLVLPMLDENYLHLPIDTYRWGFFSLDILPRNALNRRVIANDAANPIVRSLYDAFYTGDVSTIQYLSTVLHVDYILWRGDVLLSDATLRDFPSAAIKGFLDSQQLFKPVAESGPWILYKIVNPSQQGRIFLSESYDVYQGTNPVSSFLFTEPVNEKRPFVRVTDLHSAITSNAARVLIEADCMFCHLNEYRTLVDSIALPMPRIKPNSPLFVIVDYQNQKLLQHTEYNSSKRIDVDLALAGNYLSYAKTIQNSTYLQNYQYYVDDAVHRWADLQGEERNMYAIRIRAYLEAQLRVINSTDTSYTPALVKSIQMGIATLNREIWVSQPGVYRYFVTLDKTSDYTVFVNLHASEVTRISIDNTPIRPEVSHILGAGLHRIEVFTSPSDEKQIPDLFLSRTNSVQQQNQFSVSYRRINPTLYSVSIPQQKGKQMLLILKEQYDPGWNLGMDRKSFPIDTTHVEVNSFANGWIVDGAKLKDFTISFEPQSYMYIGTAISGVSLGIGIVFWFMKKHEKS